MALPRWPRPPCPPTPSPKILYKTPSREGAAPPKGALNVIVRAHGPDTGDRGIVGNLIRATFVLRWPCGAVRPCGVPGFRAPSSCPSPLSASVQLLVRIVMARDNNRLLGQGSLLRGRAICSGGGECGSER